MKRRNFMIALRWTVRLLAIVFTLFVSVFALDVFSQKDWLLALIIHLIPSYFLIGFTIIAWKNEVVGGALFIIASIIFMVMSQFGVAVMYVPGMILGLLFLLSGWLKKTVDDHDERNIQDSAA